MVMRMRMRDICGILGWFYERWDRQLFRIIFIYYRYYWMLSVEVVGLGYL